MPLPVTEDGNLVYIPDGEVLNEWFWDRNRFSCTQGPIGCLSAETEYLSPQGWRRIDEYDGGEVLCWSEDGSAWFDMPEAYVDEPCDEMWSFSNEHSLSMVLSDEHRVPLIDRNGNFRVRLAADVAAAPGRYNVPVSFSVGGEYIREAEVRLRVAIAADGCLPKRSTQVVVTVRKERKKIRMRQLLSAAGLVWKEHQHSTRETELTFAFERKSWMSKTLDFWQASSETLEIVMDEFSHWDGLYVGPDLRFDSTSRENAEMIQYAAHATGRRATITVKSDQRGKDWNPIWTVHIAHKDSPKAKVGIRSDAIKIERIASPDGRKYCFTTPTGFFIARHNGRVFVTGNSGTSTAGCQRIWVLAMDQEPDMDGVRRTRWIVTRETYKELRETTVKTWLDWFPEDQWGPFIRSEPMYHQLRQPAAGGGWELIDHPDGKTKIDAEVIFLAIDDPDTAEKVLASYEITGFFKNEGQFTEKAVIDELLSRCGRYPSMRNGPGASWYGGWMDMNAPVEGHWVPYMRGDIPLPVDMSDDERMAFDKPSDWKFYVQPPGLIEKIVDGRPTYAPNPKAENQKHLVESYMLKVQGKPKSWIDRRVLNKVGIAVDGKAVYPTFSEEDHVNPQDARPTPGLPIIVGLDFGREPAAVFAQERGGVWTIHSELIGDNESAELFAPRVKRHLAQHYPGFKAEFWGDPRGADGTQATEQTAFDIYRKHGMTVLPATLDNNPEMRRSTVEAVLSRRNGFRVNPSCLVLKRGMAGGYHYRKIKGLAGQYAPKPVKNAYSHVVEAMENALLGGGEGYSTVRGTENRPKPVHMPRKRLKLRR